VLLEVYTPKGRFENGMNIFGAVNSGFRSKFNCDIENNTVTFHETEIHFVADLFHLHSNAVRSAPTTRLRSTGIGVSIFGGYNVRNVTKNNTVNILNSRWTADSVSPNYALDGEGEDAGSIYTKAQGNNVPKIYGGANVLGQALNNTVNILSSDIDGFHIYGGGVFEAEQRESVTGNTVRIKDSVIRNTIGNIRPVIAGGIIWRNNWQHWNAGYLEKETTITGNKVIIEGSTVFSGVGTLAGGYHETNNTAAGIKKKDAFRLNELHMIGSKNIEVNNLTNFEYYRFTLPKDFRTVQSIVFDAMLIVNNLADLYWLDGEGKEEVEVGEGEGEGEEEEEEEEGEGGGNRSFIDHIEIDPEHDPLYVGDELVLILSRNKIRYDKGLLGTKYLGTDGVENKYTARHGDVTYGLKLKLVGASIIAEVISSPWEKPTSSDVPPGPTSPDVPPGPTSPGSDLAGSGCNAGISISLIIAIILSMYVRKRIE
jgi:hypothetical protein